MHAARADRVINRHTEIRFVIPTQAGIQWYVVDTCKFHWTPACAGVTELGDC